MSLTFHVRGKPAAQGSMRHVGHGRMIPQGKALIPWRNAVAAAAKEAAGDGWEPLDRALSIHLNLFLPRPKTTKFLDWPAGTPDLDKLIRAIGDALTQAAVITDDARIVSWHANKLWAIGTDPGADITIHDKGDLP